MKTVCIYHSIDLDGWMSAAIVKHWFISNNKNYIINGTHVARGGQTTHEIWKDNSIDFIGYNYGQPIPDLSKYDKVIMCDISFPNDKMFGIVEILNKELIWIDHHISAIKDCVDVELVEGIRDTNYAACELTWMYFLGTEIMPEIVRLLGRYDCFGHKGTNEETKVLEFQYGARQCIYNYELAYEYLQSNLIEGFSGRSIIKSIHDSGISIYQYLCTEAKQSYKNGFAIKFESRIGETAKFICINKERFNPINFGIDYHKDGYDGCACFHYANDIWNFSLYNDNGLVDCSVIAKQFGGGGHKGASGFKIKDLSLIFT